MLFWSVTTDNTFRSIRYCYTISQFLHNSPSHLRIFTGGHQSKGFQCSLICISHSPHPKDPALRPPGNPSETCPLLSRLAQETVVAKRPKPSQKWQTAVFSIRKTLKFLLLELEDLHMRMCAWLYGEKKTVWYKEGHTERLPGMFLPEKDSFPESLQRTFFVSPAVPFTVLLYRSREVSSWCSGTTERIFQSPVSKGAQAPCCYGHLQT